MRTSRNPTCPDCGGRAVPILYGYPLGEIIEAADRGEAELGGCEVTGDDPRWHCRSCGHRWGRATRDGYAGAAFVSRGFCLALRRARIRSTP